MATRYKRLAEAVETSTHNLCLELKIRITCTPQFYYIKVGFKEVFISLTCFPDGMQQGYISPAIHVPGSTLPHNRDHWLSFELQDHWSYYILEDPIKLDYEFINLHIH